MHIDNPATELRPATIPVARILVADDRPIDRGYYRTVLGYGGYEVLEAGCGNEALDLVRSQRPDLVLTDGAMPGLDGYALIKAIRADAGISSTRVIFCTAAYRDQESQELAAAMGAERFLVKPVEPLALLSAVDDVLRSEPPACAPMSPDLERAHLQLLNGKLMAKMAELEAQIAERERAELALRDSEGRLEIRVAERTAELQAAIVALHEEQQRQQVLMKEVEETHAQLLQAEKMASIGRLAAGMAHEINNPIGYIRSNLGRLKEYVADLLQLLSAYEQAEALLPAEAPARIRVADVKAQIDIGYVREESVAALQDSLDGVARVQRIVGSLRDFSHVDNLDWVEGGDLHRGLDSTLDVLCSELKLKADVVKDYGELPAVECVPSLLNQVFMNLLINAVQAIEVHGTITIRTGTDGPRVWVEIADTGQGIAPEILSHVFDPFFTTRPVGQGTGLGLSISYGIVKKHGGTIEVTSNVGKGSAFRITLPQRRERLVTATR